MKLGTLGFVVLISVFLAGCASLVAPQVSQDEAALRAGTYKLDETHAALLFRINHLGFSNYLGRFERFSASLSFDADQPETGQVDAIVDMASLDIANKDFAKTLLGPQWFDAAQFPEARFTSRTISVTGENEGIMTGDLTLHGVTRPVSFDVIFNGGARDLLRGNAYVVGFSATARIDRTEFGISRFAGVLSNVVDLEIEAEFIRR